MQNCVKMYENISKKHHKNIQKGNKNYHKNTDTLKIEAKSGKKCPLFFQQNIFVIIGKG